MGRFRHWLALALLVSVGAGPLSAETIDGQLLTVVNAAIARSRLGVIITTTNGVLIAAGSGVAVSTNATSSNVTYTLSVTAGGTNTLFQTNGAAPANLGSAGTLLFDTGVTGYLAGAVAHLGVSVSGGAGTPAGNSGDVQFNETGAFAGTNRFNYDRTNRQTRITEPGFGVLMNPQGLFQGSNQPLRFGVWNGGTSVSNWSISASGHWLPGGTNVYDIGDWATPVRTNWAGQYEAKGGLNAAGGVNAGSATATNGVSSGAGTVNGLFYVWDKVNTVYRQAMAGDDTAIVFGEAGIDQYFTADRSFFSSSLFVSPDNTQSIGDHDLRWRDGWFANTLNTTGLVAGVSYAALTSGRYNDETNQFTIYVGNGSTRTNYLNSASAVGAIHCVSDRGGTAAGTNLFVRATSGLVHNGTTDSITANYECRCYQWDGTNWWRISKS